MKKQTILTSAIAIIALAACVVAFNQSRRADNLNNDLKLAKADYSKIEKEIKSEHVGTKYQGTFKESSTKQTVSQMPEESTSAIQNDSQTMQAVTSTQSATQTSTATAIQSVPDYKPNGQYMKFSQYQETLKQAGYNNVTLDPQNTTNKQADGYVYSVYPNVGTQAGKNQEIVVTYSTYKAPSSSTSESTFKN